MSDFLSRVIQNTEGFEVPYGFPEVTETSFSTRRFASGVWSPLSLFKSGEQGAWYDPSDISTLFQDSAGTIPVTADGDPVGLMLDKSGNINNGTQPVSVARSVFNTLPSRLTIDKVDDAIVVNVPVGGWIGSMVIATSDGTASYGVDLPAGDYEIGGNYFSSNTINGVLLREGVVDANDLAKTECYFVGKGAKASYGDATNFNAAWYRNNLTSFPLLDVSSGVDFRSAWNDNNLTSFPLLDVSNGTNFRSAWQSNNLTSFPLLDVSNGTNFRSAWNDNNLTSFPLLDVSNGTNFRSAWLGNNLTSFPLLDVSSGVDFRYAWNDNPLVDFPANMFDNCLAANFDSCFSNTDLSESSIDAILTSINSNGTSNGTFDQSGGSAPSAAGESAISSMRSRGWVVTVTGGY